MYRCPATTEKKCLNRNFIPIRPATPRTWSITTGFRLGKPARALASGRRRIGHSKPISHGIIPTILFIRASITTATKISFAATVTIIRTKSVHQRVESFGGAGNLRSEEHTSELQSHSDLVCRLLLE